MAEMLNAPGGCAGRRALAAAEGAAEPACRAELAAANAALAAKDAALAAAEAELAAERATLAAERAARAKVEAELDALWSQPAGQTPPPEAAAGAARSAGAAQPRAGATPSRTRGRALGHQVLLRGVALAQGRGLDAARPRRAAAR